MSEIVIIAELQLAAGREAEALELLSRLCDQTHAKDDGCLLYAVHRVAGDPTGVFLVEKWRSRDDLDRHIASDHIREKRAREGDLFAGPAKATFVEPVGFGLPSMASL